MLVSIDDFDTMPPGNFDDEQLTTATVAEQDTQKPLPRLDGVFTQSSVMVALRGTLPQRLAIAKFLNDLSSRGTYEETLRLDADLRAVHLEVYPLRGKLGWTGFCRGGIGIAGGFPALM